MNLVSFFVLVLGLTLIVLGVFVVATHYLTKLRKTKDLERSLKMVPLLIQLPPVEKSEGGSQDSRESFKANVARAEAALTQISGIVGENVGRLYGHKHLALEVIAQGQRIYFYLVVPYSIVSSVKKAVGAGYPNVQITQVEDHNIFSDKSNIKTITGGEFYLGKSSYYPIANYHNMEFDAIGSLLNSLSELSDDDGAAIQILIRPNTNKKWYKSANSVADAMAKGTHKDSPWKDLFKHLFSYKVFFTAIFKHPDSEADSGKSGGSEKGPSAQDQKKSEQINDKANLPTFETLVRVIVSSDEQTRSSMILNDIKSSFTQFNLQGLNNLKFYKTKDSAKLATDYIFHFFPVRNRHTILSVAELATIWHLPEDIPGVVATPIERTARKEIVAPQGMPNSGLLLGSNVYKSRKVDVYLSDNDRRRHMYVIGQTGTGKSTILENLTVQDAWAGKGFALVDPHGETAEKLIGKLPPERIADVVYFNPGDTSYPMGLNILEYDPNRPEQKDFLIQECISMLYKLYDPKRSGIIGPRFEQWFRNAALTVMSGPDGGTYIEIPKPFMDKEYLKQKFKHMNDITVQDFWLKEIPGMSEKEKGDILGWFASKFGAFVSNGMMRNIIGQTHSAFNIRQIMDQGKILIINLSKGATGELNANLLGQVFVMKILTAAFARTDTPEDQRKDFTLYVDEFQNFATDSFATILSEARKYHLSLIVANQFIGQLTEEIRDAVFGNVGSIISYRTGTDDAEYLVKPLGPEFEVRDLVNLPNFYAATKLIANNIPTKPFTMEMLPPIGQDNPQIREAVINYARQHYAKRREDIEPEIFKRLKGNPPPKPPTMTGAKNPFSF